MQTETDPKPQGRDPMPMANIHLPTRPVVEAYDRYLNSMASELDARNRDPRR